jgi:hypothetical protein
MLTLYIQNVKTVKGIADYKYIVMVNAEKIAEGKVRGIGGVAGGLRWCERS